MKINGMILLVALALFASLTAFGQSPPPNDNLANATVLTGTDIIFSGTLAEATLEFSQEVYAHDYQVGPRATQSVWWTWTAPVSTVMTLQALNATSIYFNDAITVYAANNTNPSSNSLVFPGLGFTELINEFGTPTLSVPVTAGTNYAIQLIGSTSNSYTLRLIATNTPVIIEQPRSQTVYSNASVLFYVIYAGANQSAFTFQWRRNGTNLPDETTPMIVLTNITDSLAGDYSVVISNANGYAISQPATLKVSKGDVPLYLSTVGIVSNSLVYAVNGESHRSYRISSGTSLTNLSPETEFLLNPGSSQTTSVIFITNSPLILTKPIVQLPPPLAHHFFRASPYVINDPAAEICINNLRQIRVAKLLFYRDTTGTITNNISINTQPYDGQIQQYLPHHILPLCPLDTNRFFDTSYNAWTLDSAPYCLISSTNHFLEEAR